VRQCFAVKTIEQSELASAPQPGHDRDPSNRRRDGRWNGVSARNRRDWHRNHEWSNRFNGWSVNHDSWIDADSGYCTAGYCTAGHSAAGHSGPYSRDCSSDAWCCWLSTGPRHDSRDHTHWTDARNNSGSVQTGDNAHNSCTEQRSGNHQSLVSARNNFSKWRHQYNAWNYHST